MTTKKDTPKLLTFLMRYALWIFIPIPFILGLIGFSLEKGFTFWNAAFTCLTMYFMEYGDPAPNALIHMARWLAPLATASTLTLFFASIGRFVRRLYARWDKNSVAVFGNETEKSELLQQLGASGIAMDQSAVRAGSYILVGSEEENLEFLQTNADYLQGKDVYLKCNSLPVQASPDPRLHLISPEETAARIFWKEHCPYQLSLENDHHFKIAVVGFDKLGEELLTQGLQYNIFSANQVIEYHVFGDSRGFAATHPQLDKITDPVKFHSEPWYKATCLLAECKMLIVTQQENQLDLLQRLATSFPQSAIYAFSAHPSGVALLEKTSKVIGFDWKAKTILLENILGADTHLLAKKLNLRYAHLYNGVAETEENLEIEWQKLDTFIRYSNISPANYRDICLRILDGKQLTDESLAILSELEHIRWCRYHYLNNWKYGIPTNGKSKDSEKKIHASLIPYDQLSQNEKNKDAENIRILMSF